MKTIILVIILCVIFLSFFIWAGFCKKTEYKIQNDPDFFNDTHVSQGDCFIFKAPGRESYKIIPTEREAKLFASQYPSWKVSTTNGESDYSELVYESSSTYWNE